MSGFPTTSFPQIEEITYSPMSSISHDTTQQNTFSRYKEIKKKNEALEVTTYSKFRKQYSTTHHRILRALDTKKGWI